MCAEGKALGVFQNGGYATHVLAMEPRHLVDPGNVDPALRRHLRVQRHHGLFRHQEGDAAAAGHADRAGRGRRTRAERYLRPEGDGPPQHHQASMSATKSGPSPRRPAPPPRWTAVVKA